MVKITKHLLENGSKADVRSNGRTPLSLAAEHSHDSIIKLLLARDDVDADSNDNNGRTPLLFSAEYGHSSVISLLLAWDNVDVNSKYNDG